MPTQPSSSDPKVPQNRPAMNARPIPRTKEPIPTVGLGTWQAFDVDPAARAPLAEVMRQFLAAGGRVIDSSPMYGRAEGIVGDVLADLGAIDTPFLATKVWTRGKREGDRSPHGVGHSCSRIDITIIDSYPSAVRSDSRSVPS